MDHWGPQTCVVIDTGGVKRSVVKLNSDNREHDHREQNEETDLKEWRHRLHYALENDLQTFKQCTQVIGLLFNVFYFFLFSSYCTV